MTTVRNLFEESCLKAHDSTKLMWLPLLDEVTFAYKGVNFTGAYQYYAIFNCKVQNKSQEDTQIPKKYQTEAFLGLSKAELITRMVGEYVVASFKPQRKTTKFPSLSAYLPKALKVQSLDNFLIQRKPKIESLIVRTLKENIMLENMFST